VVSGLEALERAGIAMGCVTNKAGRFTEPLLELTGLRRFFGVVVSGDTVERKKPHPDPMLYAAGKLGASPAETLVVGDSLNDVQSARAAGCAVVVVPYGYREGLSLEDLGADAVVASVEEAARSITMSP
jgi:phosphoglycolate phosphatase